MFCKPIIINVHYRIHGDTLYPCLYKQNVRVRLPRNGPSLRLAGAREHNILYTRCVGILMYCKNCCYYFGEGKKRLHCFVRSSVSVNILNTHKLDFYGVFNSKRAR